MKRFIMLILSAVTLFSACEALPAAAPDSAKSTVYIAEPSAMPAQESTLETNSPTVEPTPVDPLPSFDRELTVLVNFEHLMSTEPPLELIAERLTADNVFCDVRRHADGRAIEALNEMLLAAREDGEFHFIIASAFRSVWEQQMLWDAALAENPNYGRDPHREPVGTMPPHCSEHITGLAFDILCVDCQSGSTAFTGTAEGRWLAENAHRFGFILRYPADKQTVTGVKYEPWHFRYVGRDAAEYMFAHNLCLEELAELAERQ